MPEIRIPNGSAESVLAGMRGRGLKIQSVSKNFSHTYIRYEGGARAPINRPSQERRFKEALENQHIPHTFID